MQPFAESEYMGKNGPRLWKARMNGIFVRHTASNCVEGGRKGRYGVMIIVAVFVNSGL